MGGDRVRRSRGQKQMGGIELEEGGGRARRGRGWSQKGEWQRERGKDGTQAMFLRCINFCSGQGKIFAKKTKIWQTRFFEQKSSNGKDRSKNFQSDERKSTSMIFFRPKVKRKSLRMHLREKEDRQNTKLGNTECLQQSLKIVFFRIKKGFYGYKLFSFWS